MAEYWNPLVNMGVWATFSSSLEPEVVATLQADNIPVERNDALVRAAGGLWISKNF